MQAPAVVVGLAAIMASVAVGIWALGRLRRGEPLIPMRPQEPVPWSGAEVAFVVGLHMLFAIVAQDIVPADVSTGDSLLSLSAAGLAATAVAMAVLWSRGASAAALGFPGATRADLGLALGGLAATLAPLLLLAGWLDRLVPYTHPVVEALATDLSLKTRLAVVLSAVIAAPIVEEFFFRRVLQGWLDRWVPRGGAVPLSAAIFAALHLRQGLAPVPLFLLGLVLGELVRRTGSLVPAILLHTLFNAVSVGLLFLGVVPASATPAG
jgi:membrane protease YdiL (CAAX protease family)